MKIEEKLIEETTIEKFAEKYGLIMEIHERGKPIGDQTRFYAHFKNAEILDDYLLIGTFGNGSTKEEAIKNYVEEISMKHLVIDAMTEDRRDLVVPRLI